METQADNVYACWQYNVHSNDEKSDTVIPAIISYETFICTNMDRFKLTHIRWMGTLKPFNLLFHLVWFQTEIINVTKNVIKEITSKLLCGL